MAKKTNKRGQGEGSIRERFKTDKKTGKKISMGYEARYTNGIGADGKQKQKSVYGKTRPDVAAKLTKILNDLNSGTYLEPVKITLSSWLDTWFNEYVLNSVKPSTRVSYDLYISKHVKPKLGHVKLKDLKADDIQNFYNERLQSGRLDGKGGLSPKTIKNMHNMLHEALEQSLKNSMILRNPCKATILPKSQKHEMRVLTQLEQKKVIEEARKERLGIGIILALATGVRLGELLGFQWKDVDIKAGTITVKRTLNRLKNFDDGLESKTSIMIGEPKTLKSKRTIPLQGVILEELKEYKKRQNKEKMNAIGSYNSEGFIISNEIGNPIEPRTFQDLFYKLIKTAGISSANFHCLRHYVERFVMWSELSETLNSVAF